MASFVHLTDARAIKKILRGGIRAERTVAGERVVFCVPVVPNFQTTFQWLRELKRRGYRTSAAVQFKLRDDESVRVGKYAQPHADMTAAEAVAFFQGAADARGYEVLVPRAIRPGEIARIRSLPQIIGWRFYPEAKGNEPLWAAPGSYNAARIRRAFERRFIKT